MGLRRFLRNSRGRPLGETGRIYITGTGRAGTTFLMQLLTELNQDTGFSLDSNSDSYFAAARAGLERDIFDPTNPLIVKSPFLCDHVDDLITQGLNIRRLVVPIRDFEAAAASRIFVQHETTGSSDGSPVAGGLWGTETSADQELMLQRKFSRLIEAAVRNEIPITFLAFPRLATDADYLFRNLHPILFQVSERRFHAAFHKVARPELINSFRKD